MIRYKGQGTVERRYHDFKGPLAVAPVFVQHNRRVAALIQVICLALLVFCLIERQVRCALGPEQTMTGLYPDNRRVRPTGRMIFYHLGELTLRTGNVTDPPSRSHAASNSTSSTSSTPTSHEPAGHRPKWATREARV
ncbi:hypothetical protein [Streptomyces rapamycinicus]|uniref:Transposase n=2 Tax=Streptomyces rapamycinicus TaxID=1226757 RepID=A0A3L8RP00_STRRN|nr:hypothetical protein [Streptomyces rapamycinicus]MBB4782945.1 hypothetical protein [Streptomyces rapamycinicus]RLV81576.1 transposase [Streptomyces rapamycinicus NRRL 5491]UTO63405.1 hypothetical protein LJB45_14430 [Streptomyces rapamycinicus]UTP31362.1 hypothetical protein LIV37_19545 [Streptomyces rapamycinicus NRRL 5491]